MGISFDSIKEFAFDNFTLIILFLCNHLGSDQHLPSKKDLCARIQELNMCSQILYLNRNLSFFAGAYFLSHSLSWSNNKENSGAYHKKVWIPEDPRSAKANGRYVNEV